MTSVGDSFRAWANYSGSADANLQLASYIPMSAKLAITPAAAAQLNLTTTLAYSGGVTLTAPTAIVVPSAIDHTGATDVTAALQAVINSAPNGTSISPTVIQLQAGGTYRCEGTLWIDGKSYVTFDGNGGTLIKKDPTFYTPFQTTVAPASNGASVITGTLWVADNSGFVTTGMGGHYSIFVYGIFGTGKAVQWDFTAASLAADQATSPNQLTLVHGGTGGLAGTFTTGMRVAQVNRTFPASSSTDSHTDQYNYQLQLHNSDHITVQNLTIQGPSKQGGTGDLAYLSATEEQHGIYMSTCSNITISNVDIFDIFGDFAYMAAENNTTNGNVHITGSEWGRNGRVGVSPFSVHDLEIDHMNIHDVRRSMYDIEPNANYAHGYQTRRMNCHNNTYGQRRLNFLSATGGYTGADVGDISFTNETSTDDYSSVYWDPASASSSSGPRRGPLSFVNCTSSTTAGTPSAFCIGVKNVDGVTVTGNTQPLQVRSPAMYLVKYSNCTSVTVNSNILTPTSNANQLTTF